MTYCFIIVSQPGNDMVPQIMKKTLIAMEGSLLNGAQFYSFLAYGAWPLTSESPYFNIEKDESPFNEDLVSKVVPLVVHSDLNWIEGNYLLDRVYRTSGEDCIKNGAGCPR